MNDIIVSRSRCWSGDHKVIYTFPQEWDVSCFSHENRPVLNENDLREKILHPIGCLPLSKSLKPGMKVAIISDDISRPTRADILIPLLLKIVLEAGIKKSDICIIVASGMHGPMTLTQKEHKFGRAIVRDIEIVDHSYKKHNVKIGSTDLGTPVCINRRAAESDFRIGIGGIYPASPAGFSGGCKLLLGICAEKTIKYFHFRRDGVGNGGSIFNEFRNDLLDACRLSQMNFIINGLINEDRDPIDLFAGDVQEAFAAGVQSAKDIYKVPHPSRESFDLIVSDAYPFDWNYVFTRKAWWPLLNCDSNCYRLIISAIPNGVGQHNLFSPYPHRYEKWINRYIDFQTLSTKDFLAKILSALGRKLTASDSAGGNKIFFRHPEIFLHSLNTSIDLPSSNVIFMNHFDDFVKKIKAETNSKKLRVGFYRAASLTYPEKRES